jgi:phenylalanyl-tRNA synthetase beta chain
LIKKISSWRWVSGKIARCFFATKRTKQRPCSFTTDEFQALCFDYGIELDEDTEDDPSRPADERPELKIEVPANRSDLLCFEGLARSLNVFRGKESTPTYRVLDVPDDRMEYIVVGKETANVRPFISGAILRGVKFTEASYASFISLQDKLHQNLARQRTLVAIGTHDLDTLQGPFTYEARRPENIRFAPLNEQKEFDGHELMAHLENGMSFLQLALFSLLYTNQGNRQAPKPISAHNP